jgi:hypothetical protein
LAAATTVKRRYDAPPAPSPTRSLGAVNRRDTRPAAKRPKSELDQRLLVGRPVQAKDTIAKIMAAPVAYSNQVVVPAGMYRLTRSPNDRVDGPRIYEVIESRFEPRSLQLMSHDSTELELEPRLAERLDVLTQDQRESKVAILTLLVEGDGTCVLVKAEILQQTRYRVKKGFKNNPDIDYETLVVSSEETRPAAGNAVEWQKVGRWLPMYNAYKIRLNAYKQMIKDAELVQIGRQMNALFQESMQSALRAGQQQLQLQRQISGR